MVRLCDDRIKIDEETVRARAVTGAQQYYDHNTVTLKRLHWVANINQNYL